MRRNDAIVKEHIIVCISHSVWLHEDLLALLPHHPRISPLFMSAFSRVLCKVARAKVSLMLRPKIEACAAFPRIRIRYNLL